MHTLWREGFIHSCVKQFFDESTGNLNRLIGACNLKVIAPTKDFNSQAIFNLANMLIKLSAEISETVLIASGLQHLTRSNSPIV